MIRVRRQPMPPSLPQKSSNYPEFTVLVVEDVRSTSALVCGVLRRAGFTPAAAFCAREALTLLMEKPASLLLLDYRLPDMTAAELVGELRRNGMVIPFIVMTGQGDEKTAVEMMKLGAMDYLVKDVGFIEHLPAVVRQLAARVETEARLILRERQLCQSEERLAAFAAALPDQAFVLDEQGRCIEVLTAEEQGDRAAGVPPRGTRLEQVLPAETAEQFRRAITRTLSSCTVQMLEYSVSDAAGKRWYQGRLSPVATSAGEPGMTVVVARDITDQKQAEARRAELEKQALQAQKMQAIGTLAGGIAHDFNNILSAILGYTEITVDMLPAEAPESVNLQEVLRAGNRAKELVRQILEFSRQADEDRKPVQVASLLKEALRLVRATMPATIEIRQNINCPTAAVLANPTQLHQICMNLVTNAQHAMSDHGGVLDVTLDTFEVDEQFARLHPGLREGPHVRLTVADTGYGMDEKTRARIFEPYFTTKPLGEGSGLGLFSVHGIVTGHRGAIDVQSRPGEGAVFNVYLPQCHFAEAQEALAMDALPRGGEHVLLVDDEPALAQMHQQILERLGYRVSVRTSSLEALEAFRAQPERFDLLFTDVTMPHMTGLELARSVLQIRPGLPVILMTGFSMTEYAEKARALGIRQLIMKPVISRDIAVALRDAMEAPAAVTPS